jgi:hypothetical protein
MEQEVIRAKLGQYIRPVTLIHKEGRIFLKFGFNRKMIEEVKSMEGYKWHGFENPPLKMWSVKPSHRTQFILDYLNADKPSPYAHYDQEWVSYESKRSLFDHQITMVRHILTVRHGLWAAEMGTGKSLALIEVAEACGYRGPECWYVGPRAGVKAVKREIFKWESLVWPKFYTYNKLVNVLKMWDGRDAPRLVCFDESHAIKTPTSQRSQAAKHLADAVRTRWGLDSIILPMTGTPAPRAPTDWWHQVEVARPGFLKEGNIHICKKRLGITEERESPAGGTYPHFVTWRDDPNKCDNCGRLLMDEKHLLGQCTFTPSRNEVEFLDKRLKGVRIVLLKKYCMDLPEKMYDVVIAKPSVATLRVAKMIRKTATRAVTILGKLRELSDGFQYKEVPDGKITCPLCDGSGKYFSPGGDGEDIDPRQPIIINNETYTDEEINCPSCGGSGEVTKYKRVAERVDSPKDDVFKELLEEHEEIGRFIAWGGFTETVDRLVDIARQQGWATLRIDGRGYDARDHFGSPENSDEFLSAMDRSHKDYDALREKWPKICVCGNPEAGGVALTLSAAPTMLYFSNSFKSDARSQSEDRPHREGMDKERGLKIIDVYHLPTDKLTHDNIQAKKRIESITLGEIDAILEEDLIDVEGKD